YLRPLLRDPELAEDARALIALLAVIRHTEENDDLPAIYRASQLLARIDGDIAQLGNRFLATRVLHAIGRLPTLSPGDHALALATALGHTCPEGIQALAQGAPPNEVLTIWQHRCGFACSCA